MLAAFYFSCFQHYSELPKYERTGIGFACFFFVVSLVTFTLSIHMPPGYLEPKYDFVKLVDDFLEQNVHLDNLCVFDSVLEAESVVA